MNEYGDPKSATGLKVDNQPGFNTGLGFYINIPIQGAGLFNIEAEWKLNFMLASTNLNFDPRIQPGKEGYDTPVQISSFFSMPRLSIIWFPEFLFE